MELFFRKYVRQSGIAESKKMINRKHDLQMVQHCKALKKDRPTIYREQLDLIGLIDTIHMESAGWGCRKVRYRLIAFGHPVGRRHCNTIFRKLGIHCIYSKPGTTIMHIGYKICP